MLNLQHIWNTSILNKLGTSELLSGQGEVDRLDAHGNVS